MNKTTISLIALAILILGSIFYFTSTNEKENKVFETETSPQKIVKEDKKEIKKSSKKEIIISQKEEKDNPRGKVIYKNDESNEGYNMVLDVPEKWSHLDYSRLGNPSEVDISKADYMEKYDCSFEENEFETNNIKVNILHPSNEQIILDFFSERKIIAKIIEFYNDEYTQRKMREISRVNRSGDDYNALSVEKYYSDINNFIKINEKTGIKEFIYDGDFGKGSIYEEFFCGFPGEGCNIKYNPLSNDVEAFKFLGENDYKKITGYYKKYSLRNGLYNFLKCEK